MAEDTVGRRLVRAAGVGLVGALAVAALVLLGSAVLRLKVDCEGRSAEECHLETELQGSLARLQALAALGCGALAGGGFLMLRRRG